MLLLAACEKPLERSALLNPETCAECHTDHYREWSGSMHAYAADDPVFHAMNAKGQRETEGALGDFCINCHAPMAVRDGLTTDGVGAETLPTEYKGVTCYFCHTAVGLTDDHNGAVVLASERGLPDSMRGGIVSPAAAGAHLSEHSPLHDRDDIQSSALCGTCHDIVTPAGVELERTYREWQDTIYAGEVPGRQQTCGACHMQGYDGQAAAGGGLPERRLHRHTFPGVDLALTEFPEREEQREAVQDALDTTLLGELEVCQGEGGLNITYTLENIAAGHSFPSGAAQDRRAWVEIMAYTGEELLWSTGVLGPDEDGSKGPAEKGDLWTFRDWLYDADGQLTHKFWEAASYESQLLPGLGEAKDSNHLARTWTLGALYPDRVTAKVRLRAIGYDVIDDLIASGDLDAQYREEIPTFDLAASAITWSGLIGLCGG